MKQKCDITIQWINITSESEESFRRNQSFRKEEIWGAVTLCKNLVLPRFYCYNLGAWVSQDFTELLRTIMSQGHDEIGKKIPIWRGADLPLLRFHLDPWLLVLKKDQYTQLTAGCWGIVEAFCILHEIFFEFLQGLVRRCDVLVRCHLLGYHQIFVAPHFSLPLFLESIQLLSSLLHNIYKDN